MENTPIQTYTGKIKRGGILRWFLLFNSLDIKVKVTIDNRFVKFEGNTALNKYNKIIPTNHVSGCSIVNETNFFAVIFSILTFIYCCVFFSKGDMVAGLSLLVFSVVSFLIRSTTYIDINSSSDRIKFYIDKKENAAQFIEAINNAIYAK